MYKFQTSKGFTLIEILIYISILLVMMALLSNLVIWIIGVKNQTRAEQETQQIARYVMEKLTQDIRSASSVDLNYSQFDQDPGTVLLNIDDSTSAIYTVDENKVLFYLRGDPDIIGLMSHQQILAEAEPLITADTEVKSLIFSYIAPENGPPSIHISFSLGYKTTSTKPLYQASIDLESTISLRSY